MTEQKPIDLGDLEKQCRDRTGYPKGYVVMGIREVLVLASALRDAERALDYCSKDDPMAVDPNHRFDASSANEWKKLRASETLASLRTRVAIPKDGEC